MVSHGRGGLAGPHAYDCTLDSARDSDSSLREPESWDKGDLSPRRALGQGGVFSPKPLKATAPLSGALPLLDSTSTRVGTPMGSGACESWDKHASDSTGEPNANPHPLLLLPHGELASFIAFINYQYRTDSRP